MQLLLTGADSKTSDGACLCVHGFDGRPRK